MMAVPTLEAWLEGGADVEEENGWDIEEGKVGRTPALWSWVGKKCVGGWNFCWYTPSAPEAGRIMFGFKTDVGLDVELEISASNLYHFKIIQWITLLYKVLLFEESYRSISSCICLWG